MKLKEEDNVFGGEGKLKVELMNPTERSKGSVLGGKESPGS